MKLDKNWRVLTVGDGDLSFSNSLIQNGLVASLTASIYDSEKELKSKYTHHSFEDVKLNANQLITEFDVTNINCWKSLKHQFDAVIFQFPLIPAFKSKAEFQSSDLSINTLNRRLLRLFLQYACEYALSKHGAQLCIITSKDVKPYIEWNLESSLTKGLAMHYLGSVPFDINLFSGYQIRNVDRDKHVKDTSGISYYWSPTANHILKSSLLFPHYLNEDYCALCRSGPFQTEQDWIAHQASKKHKQMLKHESDWEDYLNTKVK